MPLYTSTGALNVALSDTTGTGRYSASGALRINLVAGTSYVGLYAADGALNVIDVSGTSISTYGGLYHSSGAIRGRTAPNTFSGFQAPDGSYYFNGLFSPLNLFANGEQGVWYDPSDFSTMFQDSAGTTPVTAVEQPVGKILDKSGRGNHASQSTSGSRPLLQQDGNGLYHLTFDGSNDSLATASIDFSGTNKVSVFAGIRKLSDATIGMVLELSATVSANNGTFRLTSPDNTTASTHQFASKGTLATSATSAGTFAAPITNVLTGIGDISGDVSRLRINGSQVAQTLTDQGTGNYGNYPLYIGRRNNATLPYNGRLYSLIVRGAQSTDAQIASTETWVNNKTKAY